MVFMFRPTQGPDAVGGVFPVYHEVPCRNRAAATLTKGQLCMLDLTATTTEILTNDSNSYLPGYGDAQNDSVWNTVIDPTAVALDTGGIFGVVTEDGGIADNAVGKVCFFGIVDAFCVSAGNLDPGDPLTATTTNSLRDVPLSNERVIAFSAGPQDTSITAQDTKKVFLHNGVFGGISNP